MKKNHNSDFHILWINIGFPKLNQSLVIFIYNIKLLIKIFNVVTIIFVKLLVIAKFFIALLKYLSYIVKSSIFFSLILRIFLTLSSNFLFKNHYWVNDGLGKID